MNDMGALGVRMQKSERERDIKRPESASRRTIPRSRRMSDHSAGSSLQADELPQKEWKQKEEWSRRDASPEKDDESINSETSEDS